MWGKVCQLCWRLSTFGVRGGEREKRQNKIKKKEQALGWEGRRGEEEKRRRRSLWGNTPTRSCENLAASPSGSRGPWDLEASRSGGCHGEVKVQPEAAQNQTVEP